MLFLLLFIHSIIILRKDIPGTAVSFRYGKSTWTLTTDREVWPASGDVDWTVFYECTTPNIEYCDERWCMKENDKVSFKHLVEVCRYQIRQYRKGFPCDM